MIRKFAKEKVVKLISKLQLAIAVLLQGEPIQKAKFDQTSLSLDFMR